MVAFFWLVTRSTEDNLCVDVQAQLANVDKGMQRDFKMAQMMKDPMPVLRKIINAKNSASIASRSLKTLSS